MNQQIPSERLTQLGLLLESVAKRGASNALLQLQSQLSPEQCMHVLNGNGGDLQNDLVTNIARDIIATMGKHLFLRDFMGNTLCPHFVDEEIMSHFAYFSGYRGPKTIVAQLAQLTSLFPHIGGVNPELFAKIEKGITLLPHVLKHIAEEDRGYWCIPHWSKVASTYPEAVVKVFDLLSRTRSGAFHDCTEGHIFTTSGGYKAHLRQTDHKAHIMDDLLIKQGAEILIIEAQFGLRHRGRSMRRVQAVMSGAEFGLGVYEIAIMLLLSPERLMSYQDLRIDALGDIWQFDSSPEGSNFAPHFGFGRGGIEFSYRRLDSPRARYGAATGFLSQ